MKSAFKIGFCFLGIISSASIHAEEIGRLFYSPGQREQIDYNYMREAKPENVGRKMTLNGIVQRHGGKRTVWINGIPQQAGQSDDRSPESLAVPVPGQSKSIKIKVGQKLLLENPAAQNTATK
jgi:hypothetical protein